MKSIAKIVQIVNTIQITANILFVNNPAKFDTIANFDDVIVEQWSYRWSNKRFTIDKNFIGRFVCDWNLSG